MGAPLIIQVIQVKDKKETPIVCFYDHGGLYRIQHTKEFVSKHIVRNGYASWINLPTFNGAGNAAARILWQSGSNVIVFPVDEWEGWLDFHSAVKIYINEDNGKIYWQSLDTKTQKKVWLKNPLNKDYPIPTK